MLCFELSAQVLFVRLYDAAFPHIFCFYIIFAFLWFAQLLISIQIPPVYHLL